MCIDLGRTRNVDRESFDTNETHACAARAGGSALQRDGKKAG